MDRNFFLQKRAFEHQNQMTRELATRHLLKNSEVSPHQKAKKASPLILRYGPAVTFITILLVLGFLI
jgi:hypothetical protein